MCVCVCICACAVFNRATMFTPGRAKKQTPSRVRGESYGGEIVGTPTSVPSSVAASRPSLSPWPSPAPTANVPR